jgi:hypothetical protein
MLTIIGKGFGFTASDLTIHVTDMNPDTPDADCYHVDASVASQYPVKIPCPGRPSVITYPSSGTIARYVYSCTNVRIFHRDSHISCIVKIPDIAPEHLTVNVAVPSGLSASIGVLSSYIK